MKNLTLSLDDETARWARMEAARREVSVSRLVRHLLRECMRRDHAYDKAMARYLARHPVDLKRTHALPTRDELHDRAGLR